MLSSTQNLSESFTNDQFQDYVDLPNQTSINYNGRNIGYAELRRVIDAERRGIKVDLMAKKDTSWTYHQQIELNEQRRRQRIQVTLRKRLNKTNLERHDDSFLQKPSVSSKGILTLPKSEARILLRDYSVTT